MRFQPNFGTSQLLPPIVCGGKSAPSPSHNRTKKTPVRIGLNRDFDYCPDTLHNAYFIQFIWLKSYSIIWLNSLANDFELRPYRMLLVWKLVSSRKGKRDRIGTRADGRGGKLGDHVNLYLAKASTQTTSFPSKNSIHSPQAQSQKSWFKVRDVQGEGGSGGAKSSRENDDF